MHSTLYYDICAGLSYAASFLVNGAILYYYITKYVAAERWEKYYGIYLSLYILCLMFLNAVFGLTWAEFWKYYDYDTMELIGIFIAITGLFVGAFCLMITFALSLFNIGTLFYNQFVKQNNTPIKTTLLSNQSKNQIKNVKRTTFTNRNRFTQR